MKRKQFTIISRGNRFGQYYVNGLNDKGTFSKWKLEYKYYPEYNEYKLINVENVTYNLRSYDLSDKVIKRSKYYYKNIDNPLQIPEWLEELEK